MSDQLTDLTQYFERIIERSRSGEIVWSQVSPTIFVAKRETLSGPRRMSIQRARSMRNSPLSTDLASAVDAIVTRTAPDEKYLFQVISVEDETPELSIDSAQRRELQAVFRRLYEAARESLDRQTGHILMELAES